MAPSTTRQPGGRALHGQDITPQKQTQAEALRLQGELAQRTTDQYRALFHSMDEGFCVLELQFDDAGQQVVDFRYQQLNPVFSQQSGIPEGAEGKTAREVMPDLEALWFDTCGRVAQTGEPVRLERYVPQVGRWFGVHFFRLGPPKARQLGLLFNDITARKRTEVALREGDERQAFLLRLSDALRPLADPVEIQRAAMHVVGEHFGLDRAMYAEITPDGETVVVTHNYLSGRFPAFTGAYPLSAYGSIIEKARHGEPMIVADIDAEPDLTDAKKANYKVIGSTAVVVLPLLKGGRWVANLVVHQGEPRRWTTNEIALLRETAERTWATVERARAEEALRHSEERLRLAAEAADMYAWEIDVRTGVSTFSDNAEQVTGTRRAATFAENLERLHPDDRAHVQAAFGAAEATDDRLDYETRVLADDGQYRWFRVSGVLVRGAHGAPGRAVGVARNITADKQAHDALHRAHARFQLAEEASNGFVYDWDLATGAAMRSAGFGRVLGYAPGEVADTAAAWEALIHPDDRTDAPKTPADGQTTYAHEYRVRARAGHYVYVFDRGLLVRDEAGQRVVGSTVDITDRRHAEEALRRSEEKFRTVANLVPDLLWRTEPDNTTTSYNQRWLDYTGQTLAEAAGNGWAEVIHPDDRERSTGQYRAAVQTGQPLQQEHRIRSAQGEYRWFVVTALPARDAQGTITHWFGAATDIEAQKQAEAGLRTSAAALEATVARRTQALQASRNLLQSVFGTNLILMVVFRAVRDEAGTIQDLEFVSTNREFERDCGRTDLVGRRYAQEFPGVRTTGIFDRLVQAVETGVAQIFDHYYGNEGLDAWYTSQFVKLGDGAVATNLNITERKIAEQQFTSNLRLLEQAGAVAQLGSWNYDLATGQFLWSGGMYQLFGLPLGQPVTPPVYPDYVLDEDRHLAEQLVRQILTGLSDLEVTRRLRVGGEVKTVRIEAVVLRDAQGQAVRVLGVDLDLSELHRLEADNLRLRQQQALFEAVQAAEEEERRRMSESLHNGIGQILYANKLRLDRLHTPVPHPDPALAAARDEADHLLGEAIRQTRALSHELVPMVLEDFGLAAALQDIGGKMSTPRLRLLSHMALDDDAPLAPTLQVALYRMAQELAQNIVKHARGATQASLELETMPGGVLLRAEDNGSGFAPAVAESPGLGLLSTRDRVALLGGQLETGAVLAGGAYVRIRIPIPTAPAP